MAMIGAKRIVPMAEQPGPSAPVAGGTIDSLPSISFAPGIAPSPFGGGNIPSPYQPTTANIGPANDQGSPNAALLSAAMRSIGPGGPMSLPDMGPMTVGNEQITMPPPSPHRSFFMADGTGTGNRILGAIGDGLLGWAGQPGTYAKTMEARHQEQTAFERGEVQYQRRRADELTDRAADANKVQYFSGNEDRVAYDPSTGTARTLYDAPTAPQAYATTLGLTPGSPAYSSAIKDYVLRSNGPTAFEGRDALQTDRYGFMSQLQAPRLANSRRNTDARTSASIANNMRTTAATQRGQTMTDARTRGSAAYQGRSGRGGGGNAAAIATGPNGHQIVVKGGRWVDAQTGAPVQ